MNRHEDLDYFLGNGNIWPPTVEATPSHPFMKALRSVLLRLPEEVYYQITNHLQFIVEDQKCRAFSVPFRRIYPCVAGSAESIKLKLDIIVVFKKCFSLSHDALIGLLAHEIAHFFVDESDHFRNESETDNLAASWGFGEELAKKDAEE